VGLSLPLDDSDVVLIRTRNGLPLGVSAFSVSDVVLERESG